MSNVNVVVSITSGRHFDDCFYPQDSPSGSYKSTGNHLIIEAKFGSEELCTDPVLSQREPLFDTELAWQLEKKSLNVHRLKRTPVKIKCWLRDQRQHLKELGYIIVDSRCIGPSFSSSTPTWFPLLNCKFKKKRPELLLRCYVENPKESKHNDDETQPPVKILKTEEEPKNGINGIPKRPQQCTPGHFTNTSSATAYRNNEKSKKNDDLYVPKTKTVKQSIIPSAVKTSTKTLLSRNEQVWLEAKLNNSEGFYEIEASSLVDDIDGNNRLLAPSDKEGQEFKQNYLLSVTIVFAHNMTRFATKAPHSSQSQTRKAEEEHQADFYFLHYSLLGNCVTTEPFHDLTDAKFPAERASVRIRCDPPTLEAFLKQEAALQVSLCRLDAKSENGETNLTLLPNTELAKFWIPLTSLYRELCSDFTKPSILEDVYQLNSVNSPKTQSDENADEKPIVGVSIMLQINQSDTSIVTVHRDEASSALHSSINDDFAATGTGSGGGNSRERQQEIPILEDDLDPFSSTSVDESSGLMPRIDDAAVHSEKSQKDARFQGATSQRRKNKSFSSSPESSFRQFRFTLDLRSFELDEKSELLNGHRDSTFAFFLRYTYPFFGTEVPTSTLPPVQIGRKSVTGASSSAPVVFPNGFRTFTFTTSNQQLTANLRQIPLIVEMVETKITQNGDNLETLLGIGKFVLEPVLESERSAIFYENGVKGSRSTASTVIPIIALGGHELGYVQIVAILDDLGEPLTPLSPRKEPKMTTLERVNIPVIPPYIPATSSSQLNVDKVVRTQQLTGNDVMQIALELELWKEQQEVLFRERLKAKEDAHLQALTSEWKSRDSEREVLLEKRLNECKRHETKLKMALTDVEIRELRLETAEAELTRQKRELKGKAVKLENDAKDGIRRIKEECDYRNKMDAQKFDDESKERKRLHKKCQEMEKELAEKCTFVHFLQNKLTHHPGSQLESQLLVLEAQKADLEKRLAETTKSKSRYKELWGKTLRQKGQLEKQIVETEKIQLNAKVTTLKHNYKVREAALEREKDRDDLRKVRTEVDNFKRTVMTAAKASVAPTTITTTATTLPPVASPGGSREKEQSRIILSSLQTSEPQVQSDHKSHRRSTPEDSFTKDDDSYTRRLVSERDLLIGTGAYKSTDRIIQELNKRIFRPQVQYP